MSLDELLALGRVQRDVPTDSWTTYKLGGNAALVFEAATVSDLDDIVPLDHPVVVVGKGSNLVIADRGFDGLVIRLGAGFAEVHIGGDGEVRAGASVPLPALARTTARAGRGGLEWMVGVPGTVGGAVRMNAGCFGTDTADCLIEATVLDLVTGGWRTATPESLEMSYRHTNLADNDLVSEARFRTTPVEPAEAEATMRTITRWRRDHQPGGTYNAGSVFKNPPGDAAGRIIDALGLKGTRVGGVSVSDKHANFFVAEPDATAQDVYDLMRLIQATVLERTGTRIEPEIRFIGFEEPA